MGIFGSAPRNACLVLGLGGSGKTSLIRALTLNEQARPEIKTSSFAVYESSIWREKSGLIGMRKVDKTTLHIADYNGQRFDQLIASLVKLQNEPKSPFKYGLIDSIVLVVDLFPPPEDPDAPPPTGENDRGKRLQENLLSWNTMTIDAIMGFTTDSLKYICLFVNKCDLLSGEMDDAMRAKISSSFKGVRSHLNSYSEGRILRTIMGSCKSGAGIADLKLQLIDAAKLTRPGQ